MNQRHVPQGGGCMQQILCFVSLGDSEAITLWWDMWPPVRSLTSLMLMIWSFGWNKQTRRHQMHHCLVSAESTFKTLRRYIQRCVFDDLVEAPVNRKTTWRFMGISPKKLWLTQKAKHFCLQVFNKYVTCFSYSLHTWMCILIMAFPMRVAPKKVQNGIRKWPQVIPARSNKGFGIWETL